MVQADASQHGWVLACFKMGSQLPMHCTVSLHPSVIMPKLKKNFWQLCSHAQNSTNIYMVSSQKCKTLEVIFKKPLHQVSLRLQRMLLHQQKYELDIKYIKGKYLNVADTLSRAYTDDAY